MKFVYKNKEYELEYVIDSETGELLSEDEYLLVENVYGDIRTFLPISLTQLANHNLVYLCRLQGRLFSCCRLSLYFLYSWELMVLCMQDL